MAVDFENIKAIGQSIYLHLDELRQHAAQVVSIPHVISTFENLFKLNELYDKNFNAKLKINQYYRARGFDIEKIEYELSELKSDWEKYYIEFENLQDHYHAFDFQVEIFESSLKNMEEELLKRIQQVNAAKATTPATTTATAFAFAALIANAITSCEDHTSHTIGGRLSE